MRLDRVTLVEEALERFLEEDGAPEKNGSWPSRPPSVSPRGLEPGRPFASARPERPAEPLTFARALELFEDQLLSRAVDVEARRLKATGQGFYTISSAGHEQNAVAAAHLRPTDPCFLHYRSGGFMMTRGRQQPEVDPVLDTLLSVCASKDDPIAEGRHKVWGSRPLWVPPQTSTIASHLPKAVGMAFALGRARRLGVETGIPDDAVVLCSFGDASANHATALTALHAARYGVRRGSPMPIVFLCEDNGIGISVETPRRWIRECFGNLRYLRYFDAEGELDRVWDVVGEAVHDCRSRRLPVFLRLECQRLWGHAGSDIETAYRSVSEIEAVEARDPVLRNARFLVERGAATRMELREMLSRVRERVRLAAEEAASRGHLASAHEVMAPLAPYHAEEIQASALAAPDTVNRRTFWRGELPESAHSPVKRTMAAHLSAALADEMLRRPEILVFGEDVGRKGGVYHVTAGLQDRLGTGRVFDTHLDETSILGLAQGASLAGFLPIPEIQYLAYVHNALDQLRGEAASLQFFSTDQFRNPMVVRVAGLAYQKGFGGHFHNDNSVGALRDIPGLLLAVPARGDDAVRMLRGCVAAAAVSGRVVVFLEPIALYHERDLHAEGDGGWLSDYPPPGEAILPGEVGLHSLPDDPPGGPGPDGDGPTAPLLMVSYANGLRMSLQAQRILLDDHAVRTRVMDVRWLNPLPFDAIREEADRSGGVLVVDECRRTGGGIADAVVAHLAENGYRGTLASVRAEDSFVPLGPAAHHVLVGTGDIVAAACSVAEAHRAGEKVAPSARS